MNKIILGTILMFVLLFWWAMSAHGQEPPISTAPETVSAADTSISPSARDMATDLKGQIRGLRRELIGGGPKVQESDREALSFYSKKAGSLEKRLQGSRADQVSAQVEYEAALDATLRESAPARIEALARKARDKKGALDQVNQDRKRIEQLRDVAASSAAAIQRRMDRRSDVLARFDEGSLAEDPSLWTLPLPDEGPGLERDATDPFDRKMLLDLARRDPVRARPIVLAQDPELYWTLWPLKPPTPVLRQALPFPAGDPPGSR